MTGAYNLPYTLAYAFRKQAQLDSFDELPKDKRPPRSIWHNEYRLTEWFDEVFSTDSSSFSGPSELVFNLNEVE